jgi:hypothetical protein
MIIAYYPSSKHTDNLKNMEFKKNLNSKHFSKLKISKIIYHV